jgi:hypothetical protein
MAVRSAIILALDPDVDHTSWPVWPEYVGDGGEVTFGVCPSTFRLPTCPSTPATRAPADRTTPDAASHDARNVAVADGGTQTDDERSDDDQVAHA